MFGKKSSNFDDVVKLYKKFGMLPKEKKPHLLASADYRFRMAKLEEELQEIRQAQMRGDLVGVADGLIDLAVVAMGTAAQMSLPWQPLWDEVQRANMSKEKVTHPSQSRYGQLNDLYKPEGWKAPDFSTILEQNSSSAD